MSLLNFPLGCLSWSWHAESGHVTYLENGISVNVMQVELEKCLHMGACSHEKLPDVQASLLETRGPANSQQQSPDVSGGL